MQTKTLIEIDELKRLSNQKEDENYRFRNYLKCHADEEKLDKQFKRLHEKYFKIYNCDNCRNCCKTLGISMNEPELDKICQCLNIDKEKFIKENLKEKYGEYTFKNKGCLFLDENKNCKCVNCLPESCRLYPYTDQEQRLFSLIGIINNTHVCPVVYEIVEELKKEYNFR